MNYLVCALVMGVGATALMDLWAIARSGPSTFRTGLWIGWTLVRSPGSGSLSPRVDRSRPAVHGERVIGWTAHYVVGVLFAALLLAVWGLAWVRQPTIGPALLVGIGTVAAPFLVMQPGMGAGVAASRTPRPAAARLQSLVTHTIFGLGLYASGWVARLHYVVVNAAVAARTPIESSITRGEQMRIPARFAPIVFGAMLSAIMVAIVSAFVLATARGLDPGFTAQWLKSCATTWPVAFPTVTIVAPWVRRLVGRVTG